ncbi:hypothetical protein [Kitasatospora sp. NPDC001527]|uniref:hypothetical protein n=1 Tax=Kitasatospora sp. NPDC001527 TaxID=3154519 RepID=UPI0033287B3D
MTTPPDTLRPEKWEDVVSIFASSTQTSRTDRSAVAGPSAPWCPGDGRGSREFLEGSFKTWENGSQIHDAWWSWDFQVYDGANTTSGTVAYGINLDYSKFGSGSEFDKFMHDALGVIDPLTNPPYSNDRFDPATFERAAQAHEKARYFLDGWIGRTKGWMDKVDAPDGDWQGSAAGAFHTVLGAFYGETASFRRQLGDNKVEAALLAVRKDLETAVWGLKNGWTDFTDDAEKRTVLRTEGDYKLWHPASALGAAVTEAFAPSTMVITNSADKGVNYEGLNGDKAHLLKEVVSTSGLTFKVTGSPFGDPDTKEFWEKVQARAKEIWLKQVADTLDVAAGKSLRTLESAYSTLSAHLKNNKPDVQLRMPPRTPPTVAPPGAGGGSGGGTGGKDGPNTKDIKDELGGGKDGPPKVSVGGGSGGGAGIGGIGGGSGGGSGSGGSGGPKPPSTVVGGGSGGSTLPTGSTGGGSGGGSGGSGGSGLPGGVVVGGSGGSTLPTGSIGGGSGSGPDLLPGIIGGIGSGGGGGSGNRNVTVPPGSRISEGRVVDSEGRPVLDRNGNPMVVGRDYSIAPDGTLLDGSGSPVSQSRQLLDDLGRNYLEEGDDLLAPNDFSYGVGGGYGGFGLGGGAGGSSSGGLLGPGGISPITGVGAGMSPRSVAAGGDPAVLKAAADQANERLAAERAARAAQAEQAALTGRQVSTTGGSGMPPMMPPGGMGAGGQGANEKDRQRTTWLAEDEEVWGTESGAVEGVIGR